MVVRQQLDRIVFDECHVVLDSSYSFRPLVRTVGESLLSTGVQLVFLTSTLPPRDEAEFWTTLGVGLSRPVVVRGRTVRPNIIYGVKTSLYWPPLSTLFSLNSRVGPYKMAACTSHSRQTAFILSSVADWIKNRGAKTQGWGWVCEAKTQSRRWFWDGRGAVPPPRYRG
ncbi:hypothetical protein QBC34DRAFT_153293 [Podospora aff. communis PSN243]|uniref:Helicase ATP-binding domain-containing protein n=1 Tax=Podospora aff. communis PSN243 TaxID=3040156 RepID=A0AAV9GDD4_9PEZI|nr:hypothetical protein QBC34DRAFT_153293 [Podospora aff. communis PSN243]